jgi:drug/metabolite transporter (DMT)-like permease
VCSASEKFSCPPFRNFIEGDAFIGDVLALFGAWSAAGYVIIGRKLRKNLSLTPYIFLVYGMAAIVLILVVTFSGKTYRGFEVETYIWLVLLALIPQLIGHSAFNWALGFLPAAIVAISLLGEPIGSTVLAYIFLREIPGWLQILGAILIFIGIFIASKTSSPPTKVGKSQVQ